MAGQQRKCANCRFYDDAGMPGNGWCTHPKRQLNSGVKLLVRAGELACRNTWGGDLFQSRLDDDTSPAVAADLPGNDRDDEVTSVSIPSNPPVPAEDRVVRDRPAARPNPPRDSNDAAHRDQEERARMMARGSRDALAHARQRFSSRRQAPPNDVVADDDTLKDSDRVVTRQQRFSDRDTAPGMPPLRTAPVPREEVQQRGFAAKDRFDTIPAIDPDFDMPGQRQRSEPMPDRAPVQAVSAASSPPPEIDQLTAYEHVLQRARRIKETKQERARPLRRADILPRRDAAASQLADTWHETDADLVVRERTDDCAEPAPPELAAHPAREEPAWLDPGDTPEPWASAYEDSTWEEDELDWNESEDGRTVAASWQDEEDDWEEDGAGWDDAYVDEPAPRRTGWLHRFGFGRRAARPVHDDAMITRHAASAEDWLDDEPDTFDDEPFDEEPDTDQAGYERDPAAWDLDLDRTYPEYTRIRPYDAPEPTPAWPGHDPAAQRPTWPDDVDDLPPWRGSTSATIYTEELPAPAPVPPPVPSAERAGGAWDVAGMPVRPAPAPRSRARLTAALPDLDDALFEDDRMYRTERPTGSRAEADPPRQAGTTPRDSFFRASRYPRSEPTVPFRDPAPQEMRNPESMLPDIESDRLDVRDVVARGAELIDRRIDVAPEIPRQCRTCRSFRSTDGGTRGWCTNEWAFTHRRMVNEDDLACVSAIGCWWLPADHLRLDLDEESDNVRTPRMDELIARNRPAARRASGE